MKIRVSSKGQVVIPAEIRRRLALTPGQELTLIEGPGKTLHLSPVITDLDEMLRRAHDWAHDHDPVEALHEERRRERAKMGIRARRRA